MVQDSSYSCWGRSEAVHLYVEAWRLQAAANNIHAPVLPECMSHTTSREAIMSGEHDVMCVPFSGKPRSHPTRSTIRDSTWIRSLVYHRRSRYLESRDAKARGEARDMSQATLGNG
jgi:hypothetical protein